MSPDGLGRLLGKFDQEFSETSGVIVRVKKVKLSLAMVREAAI